MNILKKIFRNDNSSNNRKVENCVDVISTAKKLSGLTYEEIGKLCDVSKTTISNWGNKTLKVKPTHSQIEPMLKKIGIGQFEIILEPIPAAIPCNDRVTWLITIVTLVFAILLLWFFSWKPCSDNWSQCKTLKWYDMPFYESISLKKDIQEFKKFKLLQNK